MEENRDMKASPLAKKTYKMEPPPEAWSKLDADLEKKRTAIYMQRANRFRWLSIVLGLLLVSFVTYYYLTPENKVPVSSTSNGGSFDSAQNGQESNNNKSLAENNSKSDNHSQARSASGSLVSSEQKRITIPSASVVNQDKGNNSFTKKSNNKIAANEPAGSDKSGQPNQIKLKSKFEEPRPPRYLSGRIGRGEYTGSENKSVAENINNRNENADKIVTESQATNVNVISGESGSAIKDGEKKSETESKPSTSELPDNSVKQMADAPIPIKSSVPSDTTPSDLSISAKNDSVNVPQTNKSRFSITAFYSPNYVKNHLKDNSPNNNEDLNEYYNREKSEYSFSTGLLVGYDLTDKWRISTGASYSEVHYSMSFSTVYVKYGLDNKLHYQYPTSWGIVEMPNSGKKALNDGDSVNTNVGCEQTVKFINVPLIIRYQFSKGLFSFYADAGFSANFMLQESATMIYRTYQTTVVNNIDGLKKINYGYQVGIGVEYNFYKQFNVVMEPAFRGSITSMTENIPINCYPYSFGLNMGLSFHF